MTHRIGRAVTMAAGLAVLVIAVGCEPTMVREGSPPPSGSSGSSRTPAPSSTAEPPPSDTDLTIVLIEYAGPNAVADARRVAANLKGQGMTDVFTVEGADEASVCVGRYKSWKDPKAKARLMGVRRMRDDTGQYPFRAVMLMPVPEPSPPNQWPLQAAPPGLYSLHVASWEAAGRKRKAQDYAGELRKRGYEAYVYHGPRLSMTTIGVFGDEVFADPREVGKPGVTPKITGKKVLDLQQRFPTMVLEGEKTPVPTMLVRIPGRQAGAVAGPAGPAYHVALARWDDDPHQSRASGVAQSPDEVLPLVATLLKQLLDHLPPDRAVAVGIFEIVPENQAAIDSGAPERVEQAIEKVLRESGRWPRAVVIAPQQTAAILRAAGVTYADILRDPARMASLKEFDTILGGTVAVVPEAGGR